MYAVRASVYFVITILILFTETRLASPTLSDHYVDIASRSYDKRNTRSFVPYYHPRESSFQLYARDTLGPLQTQTQHGWTIKYCQISSTIIPVQVAASVLEDFFLQGLREVQRAMVDPTSTARSAFQISIGSVFLNFLCDEGDIIALWGVEIIMGVMLHQVRMGWTNEFTSEWFHPVSGKKLWITLSMLRRIVPGPDGLS